MDVRYGVFFLKEITVALTFPSLPLQRQGVKIVFTKGQLALVPCLTAAAGLLRVDNCLPRIAIAVYKGKEQSAKR